MNTKYVLKEVNSRFILTEKNHRYLVTESGATKQKIFDSREEAEGLKEKLEATFPFMIFVIEEVKG